MRILMTGATGFIGGRIVSALLNNNAEISIIKRQHSDTSHLTAFFPRLRFFDIDLDSLTHIEGPFDLILHCATDYGRVSGTDINFPNCLLPQLLLAEAPRWHTHSFITLDTMLNKNISEYARTKAIFREYLHTQKHLRVVNLKSDYVYGPRGHDDSFVTSVIHRLLKNAASIPLTQGEQYRDFIYIDDLVSALLCIISHLPELPKGCSSFEAVTESPISIHDMIALLCTLTNNTETTLEFGAIPYREHEQMHIKTSSAALRAMGWGSQWNLQDGLKNTIAYERQKQCTT